VVDGAAVQGRNIPLTSLLTMGESWHNNHHAFPGSARLGLYAGEWDPGWWMLLVLLGVEHPASAGPGRTARAESAGRRGAGITSLEFDNVNPTCQRYYLPIVL
jgi:stearoyl-CoA desaturase (delta-9 desaturase)